ncbi:branched-chain amino acid ABC transporter permease [Nakamurella sp. YIM 132087]|uniref:Branched-chain amino acid ABC transporter permease n=1 Tax=Nakamurella alba TaxID=2665158 RepID=A0A7K1FFC5_9ACTN|nr:branched-chain amino acid ABC transporter permease [Nakamurella alba]MTD12776.1 branched-chain amino acid ABC transporter permease [Nakamurella alba]
MSLIIQNIINALNLGCLFALYALGVAMVFGILQLINFAHSSLIMAGAYTLVLTGSLPLWLRIVLALVVCVVLSLLLDLVAFRGVRGANPATLLVTSFGVSIAMASLAEALFGTLPMSTQVSEWLMSSWRFGQVFVPRVSVFTVLVTALLLIGLTVFLTKTSIGLQMRAASADFSTARMLGVNANRVISVAFVISGVLAAVASIFLLTSSGSVTPDFGVDAMLFGLVAAVAGGLSSLKGAAIGGLALGITSQVLQTALPLDVKPFRDAILFAAVFLLLVLRPSGIIRTSEGVRV